MKFIFILICTIVDAMRVNRDGGSVKPSQMFKKFPADQKVSRDILNILLSLSFVAKSLPESDATKARTLKFIAHECRDNNPSTLNEIRDRALKRFDEIELQRNFETIKNNEYIFDKMPIHFKHYLGKLREPCPEFYRQMDALIDTCLSFQKPLLDLDQRGAVEEQKPLLKLYLQLRNILIKAHKRLVVDDGVLEGENSNTSRLMQRLNNKRRLCFEKPYLMMAKVKLDDYLNGPPVSEWETVLQEIEEVNNGGVQNEPPLALEGYVEDVSEKAEMSDVVSLDPPLNEWENVFQEIKQRKHERQPPLRIDNVQVEDHREQQGAWNFGLPEVEEELPESVNLGIRDIGSPEIVGDLQPSNNAGHHDDPLTSPAVASMFDNLASWGLRKPLELKAVELPSFENDPKHKVKMPEPASQIVDATSLSLFQQINDLTNYRVTEEKRMLKRREEEAKKKEVELSNPAFAERDSEDEQKMLEPAPLDYLNRASRSNSVASVGSDRSASVASIRSESEHSAASLSDTEDPVPAIHSLAPEQPAKKSLNAKKSFPQTKFRKMFQKSFKKWLKKNGKRYPPKLKPKLKLRKLKRSKKDAPKARSKMLSPVSDRPKRLKLKAPFGLRKPKTRHSCRSGEII